ncbi:methyltransferase [Patescibacteria group bacterium]
MIDKYFNLLIPQTIEEFSSPFNKNIKVVKFGNRLRIEVNKMIQSGGMVRVVWEKGLDKVKKTKPKNIKNVLLLGLGGGTAVQIIRDKFPQVKITAVEIDPVMVKIAKKYFDLDSVTGFEIKTSDALNFVKSYIFKKLPLFDLILVDMYVGEKIPKKTEADIFLKNLKKIKEKNGLIIFNRLFYQKHKNKTKEFVNKVDKNFSQIELFRAYSNLLVFVKDK